MDTNNNIKDPIIITGAERSGGTLVAHVFDIVGAWKGDVNKMLENEALVNLNKVYKTEFSTMDDLMPRTENLHIPYNFKQQVLEIIEKQGYYGGHWFVKDSQIAQLWPLWNYAFPDAKWIVIRRRTGDIIKSCVETAYMDLFKSVMNQKFAQVDNEVEGWRWWVHRYEEKFREMLEQGVNAKIVWPERMVQADYKQIYETLNWAGLRWDSTIVNKVDPLLDKSRRYSWH